MIAQSRIDFTIRSPLQLLLRTDVTMVLRLIQALRGFPQLWEGRHSEVYLYDEDWNVCVDDWAQERQHTLVRLLFGRIPGLWHLELDEVIDDDVSCQELVDDDGFVFSFAGSSQSSQRSAVLLGTSLSLDRRWDYIF